jgi:hypothetical protein
VCQIISTQRATRLHKYTLEPLGIQGGKENFSRLERPHRERKLDYEKNFNLTLTSPLDMCVSESAEKWK